MNSPAPRYSAAALSTFAHELLMAAGLPSDRAHDVAEVLLEGDLMGHVTHGLALLPLYLEEIVQGRMVRDGEPEVVADHGSAFTWDGGYRPGPWLILRAIAAAEQRLAQHPLVTAVIRRSHHIACLEAFLPPVTAKGHFILLTCSDPANAWVVPPGAVEPRYSPNPIAAGIPTEAEPILVDISLSTTSANACIRAARTGARLPGPWLSDPEGRPTDDPRAMVERRAGGLFPLGGADLGYKGFGLGLIVEALTSALGGHGRSDGDARWGCSVFLMLIDPARFGGREAFLRETSHLAASCRSAPTPAGADPVRLPGAAALARRRQHLAQGVTLRDDVMPNLAPWSERWGITPPEPLTSR